MQNNVNFCELTPFTGTICRSQLGLSYLPTYLSKKRRSNIHLFSPAHPHSLVHVCVFVKICPFLFGWSRLIPGQSHLQKNGQILAKSDRAVIARPTKDQGRNGGGVASWRYWPPTDRCWGVGDVPSEHTMGTNTSPLTLRRSSGDQPVRAQSSAAGRYHDAAQWSLEKLLIVEARLLGAVPAWWRLCSSAISSQVRGAMIRGAG